MVKDIHAAIVPIWVQKCIHSSKSFMPWHESSRIAEVGLEAAALNLCDHVIPAACNGLQHIQHLFLWSPGTRDDIVMFPSLSTSALQMQGKQCLMTLWRTAVSARRQTMLGHCSKVPRKHLHRLASMPKAFFTTSWPPSSYHLGLSFHMTSWGTFLGEKHHPPTWHTACVCHYLAEDCHGGSWWTCH